MQYGQRDEWKITMQSGESRRRGVESVESCVFVPITRYVFRWFQFRDASDSNVV